MDEKTSKGSKWPAEGLHYTLGSTRGGVHTGIALGQTEFQSALVHVAAWCQARRQVHFLAATVLGVRIDRAKGSFFCSWTRGEFPNGITTFLLSGRYPFKQNKQNKNFLVQNFLNLSYINN